MCRLLQQLRGFPREQPVKRLELLGFAPRVGYGIGAHRGRGTRVADPALQSLDLMKLDVQGAERRVDPDHVGQIDILFTRAALYHRFRAAGGLR